jgi:hypothetical protein
MPSPAPQKELIKRHIGRRLLPLLGEFLLRRRQQLPVGIVRQIEERGVLKLGE